MADELHVDPSTGLPRNLLGATSLEELRHRAAGITAAAIRELELHPITGDHDLAHLQAIHAHIFRDIYPWAGMLRNQHTYTSELFLDPNQIRSTVNRLFGNLADYDHLRGLQPTDFTVELSSHYAWLNSIQPFSDGNRPTIRAFFSQLAHDSGYQIRWQRLTPEMDKTLCHEAKFENHAALAVVFHELIEPIEPVYGSPEQTGRALRQLAHQAEYAAQDAAATAAELSKLPTDEGRLMRVYAQARAVAVEKAAVIESARRAQEQREATTRYLPELEDKYAQVLAALNPAHGRITRRARHELSTQREQIEEELRITRAELTGLTVEIEAAGPADTWHAAQRHANALVEDEDRYMLHAELNDAMAITGLEQLASQLLDHAKDLRHTATLIEAGVLTPQQVGVPVGAVVPQPNLAPPTTLAERPAPQAHP
jgi:cell filamentation protein, protein adenylyltransferase